MAKGRPDWTTSINITGQDYAEVIERPKYGAAFTTTGEYLICEGAVYVLLSITGTGMIYGGSLIMTGTFDPSYMQIRIVIDDEPLEWVSLTDLNTWQLENETMFHFYEKYYSTVNDKYVTGITRGITFEESWNLEIENAAGSGACGQLKSILLYALI